MTIVWHPTPVCLSNRVSDAAFASLLIFAPHHGFCDVGRRRYDDRVAPQASPRNPGLRHLLPGRAVCLGVNVWRSIRECRDVVGDMLLRASRVEQGKREIGGDALRG